MQKELIYEKLYPKESIDDLFAAANAKKVQHEKSAPAFANVEELMAWVYQNVEYEYLPARKESAERFIKVAMETSELFEIDTKIWRFKDHITVEYCFDCAGAMGFLKDSLIYADDIAFFKDIDGYDITLHIDHYTHAVYRNGIRTRP